METLYDIHVSGILKSTAKIAKHLHCSFKLSQIVLYPICKTNNIGIYKTGFHNPRNQNDTIKKILKYTDLDNYGCNMITNIHMHCVSYTLICNFNSLLYKKTDNSIFSHRKKKSNHPILYLSTSSYF